MIISNAILDEGRIGYYSENGMIYVLWEQVQWLHELIFHGYAEGGGYLEREVLSIGCANSGTNGFDPAVDLMILPPPPTKTEAYLTMDDPLYPAIQRVKRDYKNTYELPATWYAVTVEEPGSLYWSPRYWPDGVITLNGVIDMERGSIYHYAANETLVIVYSQPLPGSGELTVCAGWNLVSLPTAITAPGWMSYLDGLLMGPYEWNAQSATYFYSDVPRRGYGFWVYSLIDATYEIGGILLNEITIPIYPGMNLIGSIPATATLTTNPPGLLGASPTIYTWNCSAASYEIATAITPGRGYWVLSFGTGTLTIHP